jgi:hypothetical protein
VLAVTSCGEKPVKGANGNEYETYQQAVRNQDFEAAYIFLDRIENDEGKDNKRYITARDFIVGHELTYLASVNSEESTKRIIYLLTEMRPEANKIPIGEIDLHLYWDSWDGSNPEKERIDAYSLEVNNYNKQCHRILDLAITEENQELAQGVLKCYVPSIIVGRSMKEQSFGVDHEIYNISYNNEDYEQALKKINEVKWNL